jgi:3-deoxy-D-manno-octulosonic-acid transferase
VVESYIMFQRKLNIFKYLYLIILVIAYILAIPLLIFLSRKTKYKDSIPQRFFPINNKTFENNSVWFHSCSLGETKAIKPLVEHFENSNISVTTNTGFDEASKISKNVRFLPFEIFLPFWIVKQKALIVMEAELWYMLFFYAKKSNTPTVLINARISDKSYKSYLRFKFLYKKIFTNIDKVFAQSILDKERLETLGATNVEVVGNIKTFAKISTTKEYIKPNELIITAGSTHKNEEELIIKSYLEFNKGKLIIVPRHPERFDEVYSIIEKMSNDKTFHRFSQKEDFSSDIVLVDKMGELINIYAISDIVLLAGAFEDNIGGHNPLEPAFFNCKIISGEHYFNQKSLFEVVDNILISSKEDLTNNLIEIEKDNKFSSIKNSVDIDTIINYISNIAGD